MTAAELFLLVAGGVLCAFALVLMASAWLLDNDDSRAGFFGGIFVAYALMGGAFMVMAAL